MSDVAKVQQLAQAAAQACGTLVQAMKQIPGVNTAAIDQSAAHLRSDLMHLIQSAKPTGAPGGATGAPAAGVAGAPGAAPPPGPGGGPPMPPASVMEQKPVTPPPMPPA